MAITPDTELYRRLGFDKGKHASAGQWPRLAHMLGHLDGHGSRVLTTGELRAILPLLLEPHTIETIVEFLGPGWTVHQVENRATRISQIFGLSGHLAHRRLALVNIAAGVARCFCGQ